MHVLRGEASAALVCVWRRRHTERVGGVEWNTPYVKMCLFLPHQDHQNNSVETTQAWDDHNKPEHWSRHEASIS